MFKICSENGLRIAISGKSGCGNTTVSGLLSQKLGITIRGIYGEGSKAEGYMYQISNQASISLSETEILDKFLNRHF